MKVAEKRRFVPSFQIPEGQELKGEFVSEKLWSLAGEGCRITVEQRPDQVAVADLDSGSVFVASHYDTRPRHPTIFIQTNSLDWAYRDLVGFHFDLLWRQCATAEIIKGWRRIWSQRQSNCDSDPNC